MKKVIAIIFLIIALVLVATGEASTPRIPTLENLIRAEAEAVHVPVKLVYAVIHIESSGNPLATSKADRRGLRQVSKEVWNIFMKGKGWHLVYDREENVRCGIRYLGDLYKMYVSWEKVLGHYHSGNPNSKRAVTNQYVKKVLKRAVPDPARCVQCGICTYNCPIGIDVRAHAGRGEAVKHSACLTCGECVARCPRGVLRFEQTDLFRRGEE